MLVCGSRIMRTRAALQSVCGAWPPESGLSRAFEGRCGGVVGGEVRIFEGIEGRALISQLNGVRLQ